MNYVSINDNELSEIVFCESEVYSHENCNIYKVIYTRSFQKVSNYVI